MALHQEYRSYKSGQEAQKVSGNPDAFGAHGTLRLAGNIQVFGARQSVGDQGRLEPHEGRPFSQDLPIVGPDLDAQAAGSMQRSSLLRGLLTKRLTG